MFPRVSRGFWALPGFYHGLFGLLSWPGFSRVLPSLVMLFWGVVGVVVLTWACWGRVFFGFEPDIVRRVETSRSGLYEGLGCSERLVRVVKALVMAGF
jgi:hypothetical protein